MPSWNIHLEAGHRLVKKLHFSGAKQKKFLLGCLLPDINNGYINRVKVEKPHEDTHYAYDQKSSLNFYAKYKKEVNAKEPICLGYLFHLYTDGYFNYDFYRHIKYSPLGTNLSREEKRKIKHHDFWLNDLNFHHRLNIQNTHDAKNLAESANKISAIEITPEDIIDVERILIENNLGQSIKDHHYIFYTKKRLNHLLDEMITNFSEDYLGEKNA